MAKDNHALTKAYPAAEYNPRKISTRAKESLRASLEEFGDLSGIVFNKTTGRLVCGHQRTNGLESMGAKLVEGGIKTLSGDFFPVRIVEWPESKEKAANVVANSGLITGEFTPDVESLLDEIESGIGGEMFAALSLDALSEDVALMNTISEGGDSSIDSAFYDDVGE